MNYLNRYGDNMVGIADELADVYDDAGNHAENFGVEIDEDFPNINIDN